MKYTRVDSWEDNAHTEVIAHGLGHQIHALSQLEQQMRLLGQNGLSQNGLSQNGYGITMDFDDTRWDLIPPMPPRS